MLVAQRSALRMTAEEQGIEHRLRTLESALADVLSRLERLEGRVKTQAAPAPLETTPAVATIKPSNGATPAAASGALFARLLQLVGRTFLILGVAFLIRALSDGKVLSTHVGIALALALALVSLGFSELSARSGKRLSAAFHALSTGLIAYPLAYEASTRLGAVSISLSATIVGGVTVLLLAVASRHRLVALAWLGVGFSLLATLALMQAAGLRTELVLVLLLVALATVWLAENCAWNGLRWPSVLLFDAVVLRGVLSAARDPGGTDSSALLIGIVASMIVVLLTLAALIQRTFAYNKPITPFHAVQTFIGFGIGVVALLRASAAYHWNRALAGGVILIFFAAALLVAIFVVPKRNLGRGDYFFYLAASAGLLFIGGALATIGELRGLLWGAIGLVAAGLGYRLGRLSLLAYGAMFTWAGAIGSGLFSAVAEALLGGATPVNMPNIEGVVLLLLASITYFVIAKTASKSSAPSWAARFPATATLFLCAISVAALLADGAHAMLGDCGSDLGFVAMARSLALVATAISLALANRSLQSPELAWVAYLMLAIGGVKLLIEDLPKGRALTLLIAFAAYGIGLIVIQKLLRPLREMSYRAGGQLSTRPRT